MMRKCEFCTESTPDGRCIWSGQNDRRDDCLIAINKMVECGKLEITLYTPERNKSNEN